MFLKIKHLHKLIIINTEFPVTFREIFFIYIYDFLNLFCTLCDFTLKKIFLKQMVSI